MQTITTSPETEAVTHPGIIAVIGCDGTGKSSLTADLLTRLRGLGQAEWRYLGLVSGETGEKIKRLPIIGKRLEHYLAAKAQRAQDMRKKLPGVGTALVMYGMSLWRKRKLRKTLELAESGVTVITDRYPQAEIPGFHYDGPGLQAPGNTSQLVQKLAAHEEQIYRWMANQVPALVIRLHIDIDTALQRKPDHDRVELCDKIEVVPKLQFNGAHIVDIDTRAPYPQVLEAAWQAVQASLGATH